MTAAYYNEIDPFAAAWLRELIAARHIAPGEVDTRSIEDVVPADLAGFIQCHFFAGIGVWSYALRRVGWPDDRPVWTGSCPCQSFSTAGKRKGIKDERHLWPEFYRLIKSFRPSAIFGEQVASSDVLGQVVKSSSRKADGDDRQVWLDLVFADLEDARYTCGAVDIPAAGFGAPHIRQRLYWCAQSQLENPIGQRPGRGLYGYPESSGGGIVAEDQAPGSVSVDGLADPQGGGRRQKQPDMGGVREGIETAGNEARRFSPGGKPDWLDNGERPGPTNGFWENVDWLFCRDEKWRPAKSKIFPLADRTPNRMGMLRGAGNAIVAPQAEAFIRAFLNIEKE